MFDSLLHILITRKRSLWLIINETNLFLKINQCIYRTPDLSLQTEKDVLIYICFNTCYRADIFQTRVDFVFQKEVGGSDAFLRLIYCVNLRQLNFRVGEGPIARHNNDKHYFKTMCICFICYQKVSFWNMWLSKNILFLWLLNCLKWFLN